MDDQPAEPAEQAGKNKTASYIRWAVLALVTAGVVLLLPYAQAAVTIGLHVGSLPRSEGRAQLSAVELASLSDHEIAIPSIGLKAPWSDRLEDLDDTIIRYGFSQAPGKPGTAILTAHNLPQRDKYLFSSLFMVRRGDIIGIGQGFGRYAYKIESMRVISPEELERLVVVDYLGRNGTRGEARAGSSHLGARAGAAESAASGNAQLLTLITCYPPTVDYMRLVVKARRVQLD